MKMIKKENLKRNYENACNDYLQYFCKVYEFYYDPYYWVGGQVGTIVCVDDYYKLKSKKAHVFSTVG